MPKRAPALAPSPRRKRDVTTAQKQNPRSSAVPVVAGNRSDLSSERGGETDTIAPAVIPSHVLHAVARCRWCGGQFRQVHGFQWLCTSDECAEKQLAHAIKKLNEEAGRSPYFFLPLPLQVDMLLDPTPRLLVHGPAGIAKSVGARMYLYQRAMKISGYRALLLRCTYDQLKKNHLQFIQGELKQFAADSKWLGGNENKAMLGDDAVIFTGYCLHDSDIAQHTGPEWDDVVMEEAVHFIPKAIREITARDRGAGTSRESRLTQGLPNEGRSRLLTNPGGIAMVYLEDHYVKKTPDMDTADYEPEFYGELRGDIRDNPYLAENYERRVLGGLDKDRYQQLAKGRWDVFPGQFFKQFDPSLHVTADA